MNVDLHTHTYPASDCSHISFRDYIAWCVEHGVEAVALTNHGDVSDNRKLEPALAAEGVLLVHGVEISTLFGDFVVFSPDLDFLSTFADVQDAPRAGELPEDAAVVWVHPAASSGSSPARGASCTSAKVLRKSRSGEKTTKSPNSVLISTPWTSSTPSAASAGSSLRLSETSP